MTTAQELLDDAAIDASWNKAQQVAALLDFIEEHDMADELGTFLEGKVADGTAYAGAKDDDD